MFLSRLPWIPLLFGLIVAIVAIQLGNWQLRRAEEKVEIGQQLQSGAEQAPRPVEVLEQPPQPWTRVVVQGRWIDEFPIYYDNRVHEGRSGYQVLMPMRVTGSETWVLVNRGWIAAGADRDVLPHIDTDSGTVSIQGRVMYPEEEPFTLADQPRDGLRWQYLDMQVYRDWSGLPVADWIVQQTSGSDDGLIRDWPDPDLGIDRHRGYALQWFSFAVLAFALSGFFVFRSFRKNDAA